LGVPFLRVWWRVLVEECVDGWQAVPLGAALRFLEEEKERLWRKSNSSSRRKEEAALEYQRAESLCGSLARVLAWLPEYAKEPPRGLVGPLGGAAGEGVCTLCRKGSQDVPGVLVPYPVQTSGLLVHESCYGLVGPAGG
jgi:hypothetical protein